MVRAAGMSAGLYVPESTSVQVTAIGARLVAVRYDRGSC
jgi:hypothetical protein